MTKRTYFSFCKKGQLNFFLALDEIMDVGNAPSVTVWFNAFLLKLLNINTFAFFLGYLLTSITTTSVF